MRHPWGHRGQLRRGQHGIVVSCNTMNCRRLPRPQLHQGHAPQLHTAWQLLVSALSPAAVGVAYFLIEALFVVNSLLRQWIYTFCFGVAKRAVKCLDATTSPKVETFSGRPVNWGGGIPHTLYFGGCKLAKLKAFFCWSLKLDACFTTNCNTVQQFA